MAFLRALVPIILWCMLNMLHAGPTSNNNGQSAQSVQATAQPHEFLRVTLHVKSGTENPTWKILPENQNFQKMAAAMINDQHTPLLTSLGYKGFTIEKHAGASGSTTWTVGRCANKQLETFLIKAVGTMVPQGEVKFSANSQQYVQQQIEKCK